MRAKRSGSGTRAAARGGRRQQAQGLQRSRHLGAGEPEVAVPSLRGHLHQASLEQLREVRARRLRRDAGLPCELSRGARRAVQQAGEHAGASGLADEVGGRARGRSGGPWCAETNRSARRMFRRGTKRRMPLASRGQRVKRPSFGIQLRSAPASRVSVCSRAVAREGSLPSRSAPWGHTISSCTPKRAATSRARWAAGPGASMIRPARHVVDQLLLQRRHPGRRRLLHRGERAERLAGAQPGHQLQLGQRAREASSREGETQALTR